MADYIDKSILVQGYVKLNKNLNEYSPEQIQEITENLKQFALHRSKFFLYADVETEVAVRKGSVITWLTVLGYVYVAVSQYPDFREGVKAVYMDAKRLSEYLISETMFELKGKTQTAIRVEARVGVIGSINNIVNKITAIELMSGDMDVRRTNKLLERVIVEIGHLFSRIRDEDDRSYLLNNLMLLVERIPDRPRSPRRGQHNPNDILEYQDKLQLLKSTLETI